MSKTTIGFLIGTAFAVGGIMLALQASTLGTDWQMIGPNAWGGTTDPGRVHTYRVVGLIVSGFGFAITALAFNWWLREGGDDRDGLPSVNIKRRGYFG